jgi:LPPG:FO 2-phospho-L-lactate transferase
MRIVVPSGGIGAARFLLGLRHAVPDAEITVIGNTADDITLFGLRVCPDLDTVMYTLGGGIDEQQGWGRADETFTLHEEFAAYGVEPQWFTLGDRDLATHVVRTQMLGAGFPLSQVTEALCARWQPGVRLLPMTDDRVETHVIVASAATSESEKRQRANVTAAEEGEQRRALHFQEWWVRLHAEPRALEIVPVGADEAKPGPGVLEAIDDADLVLLPPSNPVVSIGTILAVPGIRDALVETMAPVIGLSPIVAGAPVRGMADKTLAAIGVPATAAGVALHYGADLLDGWLVDTSDAAAVEPVEEAGILCRDVPLLMTSVPATAQMALAGLGLAAEVER